MDGMDGSGSRNERGIGIVKIRRVGRATLAVVAVLAGGVAAAQTPGPTAYACLQGRCAGYGPPIGAAVLGVGPYTDLSQSPPTQYVSQQGTGGAFVWVVAGGGSGPGAGVASFNGRAGTVTPTAGDYTPAQVGAFPADGTTVLPIAQVPTIPAAKISGLATSATTDTTNATNITTGTLPAAQLPPTVPQTNTAQTITQPYTFTAGPVVQVKAVHNHGDSITAGTGVANIINSYAVQLDSDLGGEPVNNGVSGAQSEDMVRNKLVPLENPTPYNNPVITAFIGSNDNHFCGSTAGCLGNFSEAMTAAMSWAAPITSKIFGVSMVTGGTWANDTNVKANLGIISTTNGSTATWTVTTTKASQGVYVNWRGKDGDGGTASLTIDGVTQAAALTTASANGHAYATINNGTESITGRRYVVATPGTHTFVATVTSATGSGNTFTLLWSSTAPTTPAAATGPTMFILGPMYENANNLSAGTDAYNTALFGVCANAVADGLPVACNDIRKFSKMSTDMTGANVTVPLGTGDNYGGTTCTAVLAGTVGQHPNICGMNHIVQAFLSMIQPSSMNPYSVAYANSLSDLVSVTPSASTTNPINGGLLDYKAAGSPGYETGRAFFQPSAGVFNVIDFQPAAFQAHKWCGYVTGTQITAASGFSFCPVEINPNQNGNLGSTGTAQASLVVRPNNQGAAMWLLGTAAAPGPEFQWRGNANARWALGTSDAAIPQLYLANLFGTAANILLMDSNTPANAIRTTAALFSTSLPFNAPSFQETLTTPASSTAACTAGQFTDDANYHYVCTATNTWKRVALAAF